jgi:hypothetical protein
MSARYLNPKIIWALEVYSAAPVAANSLTPFVVFVLLADTAKEHGVAVHLQTDRNGHELLVRYARR